MAVTLCLTLRGEGLLPLVQPGDVGVLQVPRPVAPVVLVQFTIVLS